MLSQYLPILVVLILALLIAGSPQMDARLRYPIRFYIVAMMFVLFDIEVIFMYPWAVVYNQFLSQGAFIFWEMVVFLGILFAGYLYLWKRGAFQWE
jgi:NADH-quinone oxidoreductase subunit A